MSGTTSVPTVAFTNNGFVAPQESAIGAGLDADYTAAFGGTLNTAPATPTGQLIVSTASSSREFERIIQVPVNRVLAVYPIPDPPNTGFGTPLTWTL